MKKKILYCFVFLTLVTGCKKDNADKVALVKIHFSQKEITVGKTLQLTAKILNLAGDSIVNKPVTWISSDQNIAGIDQNGLISAISKGVTKIKATCEGISDEVEISIKEKVITSVKIQFSQKEIIVGSTLQFNVKLANSADDSIINNPVTWMSSDQKIASINQNGLITAINKGVTKIKATCEGISDEVEITIKDKPIVSVKIQNFQNGITIGQKIQLIVKVTNSSGELVTNRLVTNSPEELVTFTIN
jgi:uncharacterized protein YjdB